MCIDVCTWLPNKHTSYRCNHSSLPNTKKKALKKDLSKYTIYEKNITH